MGGSGGGFFGSPVNPLKLREEIDKALSDTERQKREVEVDQAIGRLLAAFNSRDNERTSKVLDAIEVALGEEIDGMETLLFGGSVAKRTFVDGLSDVDSLVVIDKEEIQTSTPYEMLNDFAEALRQHLPQAGIKEISAGAMAVTIEYLDGLVVQLLPAARTGSGLLIADGRSGWRAITPKEFTDALTRANQRLDQALIPTIKLAKAAMSKLPDDIRPTGYHVEAIALKTFEKYSGERRPRVMLPLLFEEASKAVLKPTSDATGQSRHVDAKLGAAGSVARRQLAAACERIARRLDGARSGEEWREVLEPPE
jgi:hypothetical protein